MNHQLTDQQALEALLIDNPDLERLEVLLDEFNLFEAIGMVRQELRHSDFLAFLLNPQQNHGLGDVVLKRLLQQVLRGSDGGDLPITPLDLDLWELDAVEVRREWRNIDILLLDHEHHLAIIIENKVGSSEHSEQLQRYWSIVEQNFVGWRIVGVFLTPDGEPPSDERYLSLSYTLIHDLLVQISEGRAASLGPDVRTLITHYTQMLRRHIMSESEIAALCRRIYRKHQRALDLIYEHRPDVQGEISEFLVGLIKPDPHLILDYEGKSYIRFLPAALDYPILQQGGGWTASGRMLLFEFDNRSTRLTLNLYIGPGPQETRQRLLDMALSEPHLQPKSKTPNQKWNRIFSRSFLSQTDIATKSVEDLIALISDKWALFLKNDLPIIEQRVQQETWLAASSSDPDALPPSSDV